MKNSKPIRWIAIGSVAVVAAVLWFAQPAHEARATLPPNPPAPSATASPDTTILPAAAAPYNDAAFHAAETGLSPSARAGREIWFKATAGNARFHTYTFQQRITALIDWYGVLRGDQRDTRFKTWGLINDPGCCTPGSAGCPAKNYEETYGFDWCPGDQTLLKFIGKPGYRDPACDFKDASAAASDPAGHRNGREDSCNLAFGTSTGALGFRKFPNPRFDPVAWKKLNGSLATWQGYDRKLSSDPARADFKLRKLADASIEPPFLIGTACASCHVAFDPAKPPPNPAHPKWENISGLVGNQYIRISELLISGMPAERYWEFEDGQVNFAGAEAGATDLARMCVTEFARSFGNGWFMVPVRLPVGALYRLQGDAFEVVDSFGIPATVRPIQPLGQTPWQMYALRASPNLGNQLTGTLFLPDSLDGVQEGAVLEHTLLVRDEMANLAWAIEKTVQGASGEPLDRDLEAKNLAFSQQIEFPAQADAQAVAPQLIYRLATPVPANWTPLLPLRRGLDFSAPLDIQLTRAGMKRFYPDPVTLAARDDDYDKFLANLDAQTDFITPLAIAEDAHIKAYTFYPRGWLLRRDPNQPMDINDTLLLEEEEVPRIGASLKRKFQYARSSDGRSWLWIGRSKLAGRGEAASGLRFDVAEKRKP